MKKLFYLFSLTFLLTASIFAQDGVGIWTTSTTTIGRIYAMVIDELNPSTMYAGGLDQGVWKTTNSGANWTQINSGLLNTQLQAIAICKNNSQVLYAGTAIGANDGVYKSTDGGGSWTRVVNGIAEPVGTLGVQALMVHPTNPNIAYCTIFNGTANATNGLYKTTDGGANWFAIINGIGTIKNFLSLAMSPADPNTIYAGSSFDIPTQLGPSSIYKSTDGGTNWILSSTGLPTDPNDRNPIRTIQVSSANPNVVIATLFMNTANGGFYLSTDAGANWTKKHNGLPTAVGNLIRVSVIRPLFDNQFFVGCDGGGGDSIGVWTTTDGGNNWFDFNGGTMLSTYTVRALVFDPTGNHTLFTGRASATANLGGVYEYTFTIIPVELVSFTADVIGNTINLDWVTATEMNNQGFEIQRTSSISENWEVVGFIAGLGTSTELHHYSFTDEPTASGRYQYRLKQINYDGSFTLTDFVEVEVIISKDYNLSQNYPNPFNPATLISFSIPNDEFVTLKIYDVLGREIEQIINERKSAGTYQVEFNASSLNSGVYYYTITAGSYTETKKMMLVK